MTKQWDTLDASLSAAQMALAREDSVGAMAAYNDALKSCPEAVPQTHFHMGRLYFLVREFDDAIESLRAALDSGYRTAETYFLLALAYGQKASWHDAAVAARSAVAKQKDLWAAWRILGSAQQELANFEEAYSIFAQLVEVVPDNPQHHMGLGRAAMAMGQWDRAMAAFQTAQDRWPELSDPALAIADLALAQRNYDLALEQASGAHVAAPLDDRPLNTLALASMHLGRMRDAMEYFEKASALPQASWQLYSNMLFVAMHQPDMTLAKLRQMHDEWYQRFGNVYATNRKFLNIPDPNRRLRVGFVSGDFRDHPVAYFIYATLKHLQHAPDLEFYFYANQYETHYEFTQRFQALVGQRWRHVWAQTTEQLHQTILADEIDVLIDLTGHNDRHRLDVFCARSAPVQVTWGGYMGTTGLPQMDWLLGDHVQTPAIDQPHYTERLYQLPHSFIGYMPPPGAPPVDYQPDPNHIRFISFNKPIKISDRAIALWSRVLQAVPHSHVHLRFAGFDAPRVQTEFLARFAAHDIDATRITFGGKVAHKKLLAMYNQADIALDPMPYTGSTTTLEALWMGVPLVTLPGEIFPARHSASYLSAIGLGELIARNEEDYVNKIIALAKDRARIAQYHHTLRTRMEQSPLCDQLQFAPVWHSAIRHMWQDWCTKQTKEEK